MGSHGPDKGWAREGQGLSKVKTKAELGWARTMKGPVEGHLKLNKIKTRAR